MNAETKPRFDTTMRLNMDSVIAEFAGSYNNAIIESAERVF